MSDSLLFTLLFAAAVLAHLALRLWLVARQVRHVARHRDQVPDAYAAHIPPQAHQKAADYTITRLRFGVLELAFTVLVLTGWTLLGGLQALNEALLDWLGQGMAQQVALVVAFVVIGGALELPFGLYQTFVIEQRHGFNRMTLRLWLADMFKGIVVGLALGLPLLWLVLWIMGASGGLWWLYAWLALVAFNIVVMWLAPTVIMPLFNKFTPLDDEDLKQRVSQLMARSGFTASGFFVMDGSRRSAHSNAFFTGFGATKRVVFFDTLLAQLSHDEMEAVLAHELGHFRHRHILKRMLAGFATTLCALALLGWLSRHEWFYTGLGVVPSMTGPNDALALILFMLVLPVVGFFAAPVSSHLSRRHEFEADAYAVANASAEHLRSALLKLYRDNASTLTPDPWYVRFHYSHPPATQRLQRMGHA